MADVEAGQGPGAGVVATWRTPFETTALILLGALGFSSVGGVALLAVRSQGVVPARARPAPAPAPPPPVAAPAAAPGAPGWAADPYGRHQWRYWDGNRWTDQVADGSTQSTDPAR